MISLPALLLDQSPDREAGGNVFCLCGKVCQISSVSLTGTQAFLKEDAAKAQSKPRTKEGLKSKKFNSTSCNTVRPFCRALQRMPRQRQLAGTPPTTSKRSSRWEPHIPDSSGYGSLPGQAPASPVPCATHGTSFHKTAATAAGRGSRTPALTGGGPGAEGGLSAHVRASVPKQSWPAPLRHRRPL